MFSNEQLELDKIPSIDEVNLTPISGAFFKIILFNWTVVFSILFTAFNFIYYFADESPFHGYYLEISLVVFCLYITFLFVSFLALKKRKYALREKDIIYSKGLIVYTITAVPISRIQHVEQSRSFLERQFNLATLKLFTAGDSGSDLSIRGLKKEEAKIMNDFISSKVSHEI